MEATCDPFVVIESRQSGRIVYRRDDGVRWEIIGECNQCGKCWEGAVGPAPTLDCPVTPEISVMTPECVLRGTYLPTEQ